MIRPGKERPLLVAQKIKKMVREFGFNRTRFYRPHYSDSGYSVSGSGLDDWIKIGTDCSYSSMRAVCFYFYPTGPNVTARSLTAVGVR